jgi:hypothetical protein
MGQIFQYSRKYKGLSKKVKTSPKAEKNADASPPTFPKQFKPLFPKN